MFKRIQLITQPMQHVSAAQQAEDACKGGVRWVQLRLKDMDMPAMEKEGREVEAVCRHFGAILIVNDHVNLVKKIGADGVHLGMEDESPEKARKILGRSIIIGGTANSFEDIANLSNQGIDYIGAGPFRFTETKNKLAPVLGLNGFVNLVNKTRAAGIGHIPLVAIGGIRMGDVGSLMKTGIHGIAIASGINLQPERTKAAHQFCKIIESNTNVYATNS